MRLLLCLAAAVLLFYAFPDRVPAPPAPPALPALPALPAPAAAGLTGTSMSEKMIDRRFSVSPGGTLQIQVPDADLQLETWDRDEAHVEVFLEGDDMREARAYFEDLRFSVEQESHTIRVATAPQENRSLFSIVRDGDAEIRVVARVPARFDVDAVTSDGDIAAGALEGRIHLRTSDGNVRTDALRGPEVSLRTSDGDVQVTMLESEQAGLQTSDGDIHLGAVRAPRLTVRTSDGDISAERIEGAAEVITSDGTIRIGTLHGPEVSLRTSDGDIRLDALTAARSTVRTSDGSLHLGRVEGDLEGTTSSGDIRVRLIKPARVSLRTGDGDIMVSADERMPADVRLRGETVRISSALRFQGTLEEDRAEGRVNGGGPLLEAVSSDGTVTLSERDGR